ncbi:ABC transporter permease [Saccharolobus islandicus]|uniref:Putative ABC-2 type transport permease n=1 Tax=Saccharolobus islandicus (strain REY15A) TaxID=930945 RepID=F0NH82_SACI5|nr:ABC transporter permease [Sulfolobus islandicus]ADX84881.1 putative ABC-2 type transport permease [Sulfolobus islandicus REY15A]
MFEIMLYEWRRAIARKKVIVLSIITFIFELGTYLAIYLAPSHSLKTLIIPLSPYLWALGVLLPQVLLIHFLAISIASGSMAEEYEQGTVDYFISKPITRLRFIMEKWLGSFSLLLIIYLFMVVLALILSSLLFGVQSELIVLPELFFSIIFSTLVFLNIAFAIGEILRRSNLSFTISGFILIASIIVSDVLIFVSVITHNSNYETISEYLPTWGSTELPFMLLQNSPLSAIARGLNILPSISNNVSLAIVSIVVYSLLPLVLSIINFLGRDISKKVS